MNAITRPIGDAPTQLPRPVGLALYDRQRRLTFVNAAVSDILGVPPGLLQPGSGMADNLRVIAEHGGFGPGDRTAQAMDMLRLDPGQPHGLRLRRADGHGYEASLLPMPGGHALCLVGTATGPAPAPDAGAWDDLPVGMASFGPDRRLLRSNAGFGRLIGLTPQLIPPGTTFWQVVQDLHAQEGYATAEGEAFLAAQIGLDRSRPHRTRRTRAAGQVIEIVSDPQPDGGWTMLVSDASGPARTEAGWQQRAAALDDVLRHLPHGLCVWDRNGRAAMFNKAYAALMGDVPLRVGDGWDGVVRRHADAGAFGPGEPDALAAQQLARDMARPQQFRHRRPDGTTLDLRTAPLPDGGFIALAAEAGGQAAHLASKRHGIVVWGPDRRVRAANPTADILHGLPPGTFAVGRSVDELAAEVLAAPIPRTDEAAALRRLLGVGQAVAGQPDGAFTHIRTTPSGRVVETHGDPTADGGWVATYTDVTAAHRLEEELRRLRADAPSAGATRSRFLATMSHELRTPLNAVIGFSDALMQAGRDGTANLALIEEYGASINKSGHALLSLVDTILDAARLESGQFDLANDRVDLHYLLRGCVKQAQAAAAAADVSLDVSLPDNLPLFRGDERRLRQVLAQLLTNAIKFTDTQVHGTVQVFAQYATIAPATVPLGTFGDATAPRDLLICVADNGIGIPEADLERVFEPFIQVDASLSRRVEGSGLGLYIGRALMRAHGGDLVLRSRVREGTTAVLRLPADRLLPSVAPVPISLPTLPQPFPQGSR